MTKVLAALVLTALVALPSLALATDIPVSPGGSIRDAIMSASPGDRVLVHAGMYPGGEWIGPIHGTAAAPITVLSVDGPRAAILVGGDESLRIGDGSSYLVFDGFEVRASGNNAIHIDGGCSHITLRNLYGHDAGPDGDVLKVNQCDHITVQGCELARPGAYAAGSANPYQQCLDFVDVSDSVIEDNFLHDGGSQLFFVKGGSARVLVQRNTFSNERAGASDPMVGLGGATDLDLLGTNQYEAYDITFVNNIVLGGVIGGLGVYDVNGAYIANNLFVDNDRVLIEFRAGNGPAAQSTDVRVENNIFLDSRGAMPMPYQQSSHGLHAITTANNLYWNHGSAIPTTPVLVMTAQPGYMASNPMIAAPSVLADRAMIIAATHPAMGSPAAANGLDTSAAPFGVMDDILGTARAMPYDRGPFVIGHAVAPPPDAGTPPVTTGTDAGTTTTGDAATAQADGATNPVQTDGGHGTTTDSGTHDAGADGGTVTESNAGWVSGCSARGGAGRRDGLAVIALAGLAAAIVRRRRGR